MKETEDILKIVTGKLNRASRDELLTRLAENESSTKEYRKIKNAWALASTKKEMPSLQLERMYADFSQQFFPKSKKRQLSVHGFLKYAAVFIFAIGIASLFFFTQFNLSGQLDASLQYTTAIADQGQMSKLILPDSSIVWLNSGSEVAYNNNFAVNNRDIQLKGEAFFQVTKNKHIPLKVFAKDMEVKVLGTRFNVSCYEEDSNISVTLESGKVEMHNSKIESFHYEMNPGERAVFDELTRELSITKVNTKRFTSWKEGILIFRDDLMADVIPTLQRYYDIEIEVEDPAIYESVFTATIKNESLKDIFNSISFACSVNYEIVSTEDFNAKTKIILTRR